MLHHILNCAIVLAIGVLISSGICLSSIAKPPDEAYILEGRSTTKKIFLGVASVTTSEGIRITYVHIGSPASKAGLEVGDHILEVDGYRVGILDGNTYSLASELRRATGTVKLKIRVRRSNKEIMCELKIGEGDEDSAPTNLPPDETNSLKNRPRQ